MASTNLYILWASQTGNCEQISEDLLESLKAEKLNGVKAVKRLKLNEVSESLFDKSKGVTVAVVICSSTGDGDVPENGEKFAKELRKRSNAVKPLVDQGQTCNQLSHVFYTILGLGSTDYSKFQHAPRFLDSKFKLLGASPFYYRAEADDAIGLEQAIEPWLEGLPTALCDQLSKIRKLSADQTQKLLEECQLMHAERE